MDRLLFLARRVAGCALWCTVLACPLLVLPSAQAANASAEDPPALGKFTNTPVAAGPVNLSTGDAETVLPLGAIAGRNGLSYAVTARYSSNVLGLAKAWNGESATGPMGLGWTLDHPKVTVDWHGSPDRGTNDYYLEMNGQRSRLIPAGPDGSGSFLYTTDTFARWRISFTSYPAWRWTMIDENGTIYVFGDVGVAATQRSIQWGVIVGQPSDNGRLFAPSKSAGSQMVPVAFNLARITEPWGNSTDPGKDNSLYFHYKAVEHVFADQGSAVYTRESHLQKVANSFGDSIQLTYAAKANDSSHAEYVVPHGSNANYYQDRYETQYLSSVSSYKNGSSTADSVVRLAYGPFLNAYPDGAHATYAKRMLASAQTVNSAGRAAAPATRFEYYTSTSDVNFGALKSVTHPTGGQTIYSYAAVSPELSALDHTIQRPAGHDRPRVWIGEGYVVVMWANSSTNATLFQTYSWEGRWIKGDEFVASDTLDWTKVRIRTGLDTIAILRPVAGTGCGAGGCPRLHALHKSKGKTGQWERWQYDLNGSNYQFVNASGQMPPYASFDVGAGTDLVSVTGFQLAASTVAVRNLFVYASSGFQALTSQQAYPGAGDNLQSQTRVRDKTIVSRFTAAGFGDLFELVRSSTNGSFLHHHAWSSASYRTTDAQFALGQGFGVIREACNAANPQGGAFVFNTVPDTVANLNIGPSTIRWLATTLSGADCASPIHINDNTIGIGSAFFQINDKGLQFAAKPAVPQAVPMDALAPEFSATVEDCCGPWTLKPWVYRASRGDWSESTPPIANATGLEAAGQRFIVYDLSSTGIAIGWRLNDDAWQSPPLPGGNRGLLATAGKKGLVGYLESLDYVGSNPLDAVTNFALPSGFRAASSHGSDFDKGTKLVGDLTAVAYNGGDLDQADTLKLFRAHDRKPYAFAGAQSVAAVSRIVSTTGYENVPNAGLPSKTTQYVFDPAKATMDPQGRHARFNHVTVRNGAGTPGSTLANDEHYGYSEFWLHNSVEPNLLPSFAAFLYPGNEAGTYALLTGLAYMSRSVREVYANGAWTTSSVNPTYTTTSYTTVIKDSTTTGHVGGLAAYTRVLKAYGTRDGAGSGGTGGVTTNYAYLDASAGELEGLLATSSMYWMNVNGEWELDVSYFTYAAQAYPSWNKAVHWISALAGVKVWRQGSSQLLSNTVTTYQVWGTGDDGTALWGPQGVYSWQRGAASENFNYANPNADWLPGPQIDKVNSAGLVTQSKYTYNSPPITVHGATLYDSNSRVAVASFSDAQVIGSAANADFWGMEDYESGAGWTVPEGGSRVGGSTHTGKKALSFGGNLFRDVLNVATNAGRTYVLSAYVNAPAGVTVTLQLKGWTGGQNTVTTTRAYTPAAGQAGTWQYVEVYLADTQIAGIGPWIQVAGGTALVDDLRVGPSEAPFAASVYDLDKGIVTASLGQNGEVVRSLTDEFNRPVAAIGPADAVTGMGLNYFSRSGNADSFNASDPNSVVGMAGAGTGSYADFANANPASGKWQCATGACTPTAAGLKTFGTVQMTAQLPDFAAVIRAQIDYSSVGSGTSYKLQLGTANIHGSCNRQAAAAVLVGGSWRLYSCESGTFSQKASVPETRPVEAIPRDWVFHVTRGRRALFIGGKLVLEDRTGWPSADNTFAVTVGSDDNTAMTLSNVAVLADPAMTAVFLDGAGRSLQSVTAGDGDTVRASGSLYDANWVRTVRTKHLHYTSNFRYDPQLVLRDANGNVVGKIVSAYGSNANSAAGYTNDGGYPYAGVKEYSEPQARTNLSGAPGVDYNPASGNGHPASAAYGTNNAGPAFQKSDRNAFPTSQLLVSTGTQPVSKDAAGVVQSLTAQALRTIPGAGVAGMVQGASGYGQTGTINLQTLRTQDAWDRTNVFYHPRYFASSGNESARDAFKSQLGYDNYDRATSAALPNSGTTQIVYNKSGQLRFWMDAAGAQVAPNNNISYRKYDRIGRVIEEGYIDSMKFDRAALEQMAEDASQPATPVLTWRKRFFYGVPLTAGTVAGQPTVTPLYNGRLRAVQSNNGTATAGATQIAPTAIDAQVLTYDERGRVAAVLESTHPYDDGLIATYAYDNLGRVTTAGNPYPVGGGSVDQGGTPSPVLNVQDNSATKLQVNDSLRNSSFGSDFKLDNRALAALLTVGASAAAPTLYAGCVASPVACAMVVGAAAGGTYVLGSKLSVALQQGSQTGMVLGSGFAVASGGTLEVSTAPRVPMIATTYAYNTLGQLTKVGRSVDGVVVPDHYATYAYGPNGEILSEVRNPTVPGNSNISIDAAIQLSYAYDSPGLLKSLEAKTGSRTRFIETLAHSDAPPGFKTYDGRIGHSSQGFAPKSTDSLKTLELGYTYYPEGGLKLVQAGGNFTAGPLSPTAFRYALDMKDANQNLRIARQGDEPSYHYNVKPGNDQLVSVTLDGSSGPVKSAYTYDANGNVVSKTHHINNITYDPFYNKASSILHEAQGPQQSYSMRYGGMLGERVWQTYYDGNKNTVLENTYFRGLNAYPLVIQYDNAPTPQQRTQMNRKTMIWGPTGLIAVNDFTYATGASSDYFVIPDHRGSTVMVLQKGSFDATVQTYAYTPTGNVYKGDGTLVTSAQPVPYLFQGQEYDWQSELHNYRARFYDSDMMMFLSPDPSFRVGESPYVAMGNDPVNNADPDGRTWLPKRSMSPVSSPSAGMR